jgi:hypothetical protein
MFLKKYVGPELKHDQKQKYFVVDRYGGTREQTGYVYEFPPLRVCRSIFAKMVGQEVSWNDPEAEWQIEDRTMAEQCVEPF